MSLLVAPGVACDCTGEKLRDLDDAAIRMRRPPKTEKEAQELGGTANDVAGSLGERAGFSGATRSK